MSADTFDRALSVPQFAKRWGVATRTIRAMIAAGKIVAFDVGLTRPKLRISADEVRAAEKRLAVGKPAPTRRRRSQQLHPEILAVIGRKDD
jgi:hypothetical protein